MLREIGWDAITRDDRSVLTVGTFDGVHRGHQAILRFLRARAAERDGLATVVSFDPHPRAVVHNADVPLLTTVEERGDRLAAYGIDRLVVLPFTTNFARLGPVAYVEDILVRRIGLQAIAVGYDHRFGRRREGDRALLERLGRAHGFAVDVIPAQEAEAEVISSSAVRDALEGGDVRRAARLLGRPYRLAGPLGAASSVDARSASPRPTSSSPTRASSSRSAASTPCAPACPLRTAAARPPACSTSGGAPPSAAWT